MRVLTVALAAALAGCSALPSQGPSAVEVAQSSRSDTPTPHFLLVDLSSDTVSILEHESRATFVGRFGDNRPSVAPTIGVGDGLAVTVWEAAAGGLFSSPSLGNVTAGSHSANIPEQAVARDGSISIPYAGRVQAAGRTPAQVEAAIVKQLQGKAIEPQALVSVTRGLSNSVTVTGEVTSGARIPLTTRGDRILDIIATTGGLRSPVHESFISLTRDGRTVTVPMQALLARPQENVYARPGDVITVVRNPQTYTAFGATGRNAVYNFDALGVTLEEAVAKAGGLLDNQSDPQGVFLLRTESVEVARQLDPSYPVEPYQRTVNVAYRINLHDANTYFLARRFQVRNKDIVYVANAPVSELTKALQVINTLSTPASAAATFCAGRC